MAPSQLKQLKASLRDHGVLGPQKSKKVRKANAKDGQKRLQRNAALEGIRERFNPFEAKAPARKDKFEVATNKAAKVSVGRPGVTRSLGEQRRRETLLKEMQSRNKVGGMLDRRFGENDPTMTPEERAAERFARQALRTSKKNSMFNLEDDSEEEMVLTHGGRSLGFDGSTTDDFQENDLSGSEPDDLDDRPTKRLRVDEDTIQDEEEDQLSGRKKTKNEVMKEVIAKSKMYKAERQAAKADDDELRLQLDKGMGDFYEALRTHRLPEKQLPSPPQTDSEPTMDPGRAAMLAGKSREAAEKEYEANLRQLKLEARSKPSVRTKSDEEKAAEQAAKLEELERNRLRRMKGESLSSDEEDGADTDVNHEEDENEEQDDAEAFGLQQLQYQPQPPLDVEDEDEFVLDDIIASGSDPELATDDDEDEDDEAETQPEDDGDDDFINGLVLPKPVEIKGKATASSSTRLAYTIPCPQTHAELLEITKKTTLGDLPIVIQRIRALYHKGLASDNQEKLGKFAHVLVQHISYLAASESQLPFVVLESLIRHLHSMAKTQPEDVGLAFRDHLREIAEDHPLALTAGDMLLLTAISTIFPTSDHFHTVTTPAMLTIVRYLGQSSVQGLSDLGVGAYSCSLALKYQRFAQRYVPEVVTYLVNAIAILAPEPLPQKSKSGQLLNVAVRLPETVLRISKASSDKKTPKLSFELLQTAKDESQGKVTLLKAFVTIIGRASHLWQSKSAFPEFASPLLQSTKHLLTPACKDKLPKDIQTLAQEVSNDLTKLIDQAITARKPLLLHNHRPLAIKSSIPQFIENFNPDRHYDPDRERAELAKLKAEHKKERKGAMRELRKDAQFVAREQLRDKKAKDAAYEKKFSRLIAEIQGEEGREAKEYEREKARRKGRS